MTKYDKYVDMLNSKILTDEDITEICKEFNLFQPNFDHSHDYIYIMISKEILRKKEEQKFKQYITKFPNSNGIDYKKLKDQINLSGRTPEQQRNDMFKIMNKANKNIELYVPITFTELQDDIIKKGGSDAKMILTMRKQHEDRMEELCDLCGNRHDEHDSRGFIYFHGDDRLKAGWSCVEEIVRKNKRS